MTPFLMSFAQKSKKNTIDNGVAFYIGINYSKPTRTEFEKYISVVSDTMHLTSSIIPQTTYGLNLGMTLRNGNWEFEGGGVLSSGIKTQSSNVAKSNFASLSLSTIDIHFGFSNYILGPLFIGADLGAISNGGKLQVNENTPVSHFEDSPESLNPFKGYVFSVRPKAGFFFPFKAGKYSGIKLNAYYDYGISKYDFYNSHIFQSRLINYTGSTKSSLNGFGAQVVLVIGGN